jgi:hypothetical protein
MVPIIALSLSLKRGILTAPGICPSANSPGDRTSITGISLLFFRNISVSINCIKKA